jgi:energy-coupling factor transport system ATP-binding protein
LRRNPVFGLSLGQQQRTALAAVLALGPRLVILDEPTVGQDWHHLSGMMDFLAELNRAGSTVLLATHDYKLVHRYARRILLLRNRCIAVDGVPAKP